MTPDTIGLIAGQGQFPLLIARAAKERGLRVVAVAHKGETLTGLAELSDEITWISLGQLGKLIKVFRKAGVTRAAMCGGITKTRMFRDIKLDLKALSMINQIRHLADDGVLRTLCKVLEKEGIIIQPSHELVPELVAPPGVYTSRKPDDEELADCSVGWEVAADLGRLDIGQCVVVQGRVVVAVEAIEGTDACIRRGGGLAGGKAVVVKRCKPNQDRRFDLPSVGPLTVESMAGAGATCLLIEAGRTLAFDREAMVNKAEAAGICLLAWPSGDEQP